MRSKLIVEIEADGIKTVIIEPYGLDIQVIKGDVIEITHTPQPGGDTIQTHEDSLVVFCMEPLVIKNGALDFDLSLD